MTATDVRRRCQSLTSVTDIDVVEKGHHVMRVFVTGASGWIGSAVVDELLAAGHEVVGLARSDASAAAARGEGCRRPPRRPRRPRRHPRRRRATPRPSSTSRTSTTGPNPAASNAAERAAVQTIGDALAGTGRPFLLAAGVAALAQGRPATEADPSPFHGPDSPRGGSENLALEFVDRGVHTVSLRFAPTVHGAGDHGFIATLAAIAREKGVSGYPGDGTNRWAAVHRTDAARLVALGLDKAPAGCPAARRRRGGHADPRDRRGDRPGVRPARRLVAPTTCRATSGGSAASSAWTSSATSAATRELLGWTPTGPTLVEDLDAGAYR